MFLTFIVALFSTPTTHIDSKGTLRHVYVNVLKSRAFNTHNILDYCVGINVYICLQTANK